MDCTCNVEDPHLCSFCRSWEDMVDRYYLADGRPKCINLKDFIRQSERKLETSHKFQPIKQSKKRN